MFDRIKNLFARQNVPALPLPETPFELVTVSGSQVAAKFHELRTRGDIWPILLGDRRSLEAALEIMNFTDIEFGKIVDEGLRMNVNQWLQQRRLDDPHFYEIDERVQGKPSRIEAFSTARELLTRRFKKEVFIGLIPVDKSWLAPAYLKPGDWNSCPSPAVHVAMFHRWYETYGAEVTAITNDVIEFSVARPPTNRADARILADEQFLYCGDIVQQGVGTLGNLASALIDCPNWYFWWD